MNNKCPKCDEKLSPFYFKENCPHCGVNLLYYQMSENLEADAKKAQQEVDALWSFVQKVDRAHIIEKIMKKKQKNNELGEK